MEKRKNQRIISLFLAVSMLFALFGCGKDAAESGGSNTGNAPGKNTEQTDGASGGSDGTTAMGRYVESETDLSEQIYNARGLCMREDGSLIILDAAQGFFVSQDMGATWELETQDWHLDMLEKNYYVAEMVMAPDGTVGVLYDAGTADADYTDYRPVMELILPDGTIVPVEIEMTDAEHYIRQIVMTSDNRIIVQESSSSNLYEVHRDGSSEPLVELQDYCSRYYMEGSFLIGDGQGGNSYLPLFYDINLGQSVEDEVLSDFINENYTERYYNGTNDCSMYILQGDDSVLYLIGDKGIHRHVIGGNMMEQIVDGNLSMLSNPSYTIISALMLENDEFLVLFSNYKLIHFTYDPNVPTVPENVLTIYSLQEDEDMRQAVSMYQSRNPDVFVAYEVGMESGSAVTREDAIKKLNTEIMAGTGPDLLVMDGLPFTSYVEKGLLADLTDYLQEYSAKEPLFDNIIGTLKIDGKAYVAPATIHLPMFIGEKELLSGLTDLSKLGEAVEALRSGHPEEDVIGICSKEDVMNRFAAVSAPIWLTKDGALNREAIGTFLEQCKRIYDAQMDGISADIVEEYERMNDYYKEKGSENGIVRVDWTVASDIFDYIGGDAYLLSGWVNNPYAFYECTSIEMTKGYENSGFADMQGECRQVFKPNTLLGINAASTQPDAAKAFMDFFLSAEAQSNYYSFPLNKEAYDIQFTPDDNYVGENREYGALVLSTEDGLIIEFGVYVASDEQVAELKEKIASLTTPYIHDTVLEDAVFARGADYIEGNLTLEEALAEIERQVAIYMAE